MKNKDLIAILEELSPDGEIAIDVTDIVSGVVSTTFDIGCALDDFGTLHLTVATEGVTIGTEGSANA